MMKSVMKLTAGYFYSYVYSVTVSVAPSVLEIKSDSGDINIEVRVRFLSFMGIGRDVTTCGLIVHTARDEFGKKK